MRIDKEVVRTCYTVHPHAVGRHGLAEAQLDAVVAEMFAVHRPHRLHDAGNVCVLTERVRRNSALLLDVDLLSEQNRRVTFTRSRRAAT